MLLLVCLVFDGLKCIEWNECNINPVSEGRRRSFRGEGKDFIPKTLKCTLRTYLLVVSHFECDCTILGTIFDEISGLGVRNYQAKSKRG